MNAIGYNSSRFFAGFHFLLMHISRIWKKDYLPKLVMVNLGFLSGIGLVGIKIIGSFILN